MKTVIICGGFRHSKTFAEKVARREASQLTETIDPDVAKLRTLSQTDKAKQVRARFFAWRATK